MKNRPVLAYRTALHRFSLAGPPERYNQSQHLNYIISDASWQGAYFLYPFFKLGKPVPDQQAKAKRVEVTENTAGKKGAKPCWKKSRRKKRRGCCNSFGIFLVPGLLAVYCIDTVSVLVTGITGPLDT